MPRDLEGRGFYRDERSVLVAQRSALFAIMEASPRRWRAPASGMRARARVRSAEAPRPADPGHRSPPPGASRDSSQTKQATVPGIWALGDCNGRGAFTHTSYNDFEIVATNLFDNDVRRV